MAPGASPPTMDVYRECATEGCAELVAQRGRPAACAVPLLQRPMLARAWACEGCPGLRTSGHQGMGGRYDQRHLGARAGALEGGARHSPGRRRPSSKHQDRRSSAECLRAAAAWHCARRRQRHCAWPSLSRCSQSTNQSAISDVVYPVSWTMLASPKRDFGDGGGSSDRGAPATVDTVLWALQGGWW